LAGVYIPVYFLAMTAKANGLLWLSLTKMWSLLNGNS